MEHALISSQIYADSQRFENATERYLRLLNTKPEILLRAPMLHIASYLQMSPETLSRVRAAHIAEEMEQSRKSAVSGAAVKVDVSSKGESVKMETAATVKSMAAANNMKAEAVSHKQLSGKTDSKKSEKN